MTTDFYASFSIIIIMPSKGKSKALALKHSYLGQFTKNARNIEEMKSHIAEQDKEIAVLNQTIQLQGSQMKEEQRKIKTARRKLDRTQLTLEKVSKQGLETPPV